MQYSEVLQRINCAFVGDPTTGKTSLIWRFLTGKYKDMQKNITIGWEKSSKNLMVDGIPIELNVFDSSGLEDYDRLRQMFYPETDVFILCFSNISQVSFENIKSKWLPEVKNICSKTPLILVGTKCDLRDDEKTVSILKKNNQVPGTFKSGWDLSKRICAEKYLECSALTGEGVKNVFEESIRSAVACNTQKKNSTNSWKKF